MGLWLPVRSCSHEAALPMHLDVGRQAGPCRASADPRPTGADRFDKALAEVCVHEEGYLQPAPVTETPLRSAACSSVSPQRARGKSKKKLTLRLFAVRLSCIFLAARCNTVSVKIPD